MRIIAGTFRSRALQAPPGLATRPTSDRLRETLFNVLAPRIVGAAFLDLYAGSGAVGMEALSRGAAQVTFVERAPAALKVLRANLERWREMSADVMKMPDPIIEPATMVVAAKSPRRRGSARPLRRAAAGRDAGPGLRLLRRRPRRRRRMDRIVDCGNVYLFATGSSTGPPPLS